MNRLLRTITNRVMGSFVGSGVEIDEGGKLCLPDGLCPRRVHRFIEVCMDERFPSPGAAMQRLFASVGVDGRAVRLLDEIIDANGDVDFTAATRRSGALMSALPELRQIPLRFRGFLVDELGIASDACADLAEAVVSARETAATRVGCAPTWDAILDHPNVLADISRPWRERLAAA